MIAFERSIEAYEDALRARLGDAFVQRDLDRKHKKMRKDAFPFLRGTCWRWAEGAPELCPDLFTAPAIPSVGDAHAENFGFWRDCDARLIWGVNDYDEAAALPYTLDLVRLCTSLSLALATDLGELAATMLESYASGLANPGPMVVGDGPEWLRAAFDVDDTPAIRAAFWTELAAEPAVDRIPVALDAALHAALPYSGVPDLVAARSAGVGSLGRARFFALRDEVAIEIKAMLPSCWPHHGDIRASLSSGRWRAVDPSLHYAGAWVTRALTPDNRKLELDTLDRRDGLRVAALMAGDLGAVHASADTQAVLRDLSTRDTEWLEKSATTVRDWTQAEHEQYARKDA